MNKIQTAVIWTIGVTSFIFSIIALAIVISAITGASAYGGVVDYFKHNTPELKPLFAFLFQGIYFLFLAIGVLRKRHWGRILSLLLPISILFTHLIGELTVPSIVSSIIIVLYCTFIFGFGCHPKVKEHFK